jgi:hypothetical protein
MMKVTNFKSENLKKEVTWRYKCTGFIWLRIGAIGELL